MILYLTPDGRYASDDSGRGVDYRCISYKKLFANRVKDELLLLLAGLCGGTIYFITENTALGITLASNVSLIVCTSPVLTTLLSYLFRRKEPSPAILFTDRSWL